MPFVRSRAVLQPFPSFLKVRILRLHVDPFDRIVRARRRRCHLRPTVYFGLTNEYCLSHGQPLSTPCFISNVFFYGRRGPRGENFQ